MAAEDGQRGPRRQRARSPAPDDEYLVHVYDCSAPDAFLHVVERAWPAIVKEDVSRWTEKFQELTRLELDTSQRLSIALADYLFVATKTSADGGSDERGAVPALDTWVAIAGGIAFVSKKKRHRQIHVREPIVQRGVDEQRLGEAIEKAKNMSPKVDDRHAAVVELSDR